MGDGVGEQLLQRLHGNAGVGQTLLVAGETVEADVAAHLGHLPVDVGHPLGIAGNGAIGAHECINGREAADADDGNHRQ